MIKIEVETRALERQLKQYRRDALPKAVAGSINAVSLAAHRQSERNVRTRFTIRNRFTLRSLKRWSANPKPDIRRINSVTGTISPYLPLQEEGGTVRARRQKMAIPTKSARISRSKSRPVASRFRMNRIGQVSRGNKFFMMRSKAGKLGIFTRRTKRKLVMVRDLSVRSFHLRARHWHRDAIRKFNRRSLYMSVFIREAKKGLGRIR